MFLRSPACGVEISCRAQMYVKATLFGGALIFWKAEFMEQGQFYFIADEFYSVHDKDSNLMQNMETIDGAGQGRPCFFAFQDSKAQGIFGAYQYHQR